MFVSVNVFKVINPSNSESNSRNNLSCEDSKIWLSLFIIETEVSIPCPRDSVKETYFERVESNKYLKINQTDHST
jgi:hypothetical protein